MLLQSVLRAFLGAEPQGFQQAGSRRQTRRSAGNLLDPIAQRWAFLVLFTKRTFGTQQADGMKAYSWSQRLGSTP